MSKDSEFQEWKARAADAAHTYGVIPGKVVDFHWATDRADLEMYECRCEIGHDHMYGEY